MPPILGKENLSREGCKVFNVYTGKILNIDLTNSKHWIDDLPENWIKNYIGGEGFGTLYLAENLKSRIDPLSKDNKLLFICGPLTDTKAPCSGRTVVMFKSPLTGTISASNAGGAWAPQLKRAGYDMLVIHGCAQKPTYIFINDEEIHLYSAEKLWGRDTHETERLIREEIDNSKAEVTSIGIAGEKKVRYATVMMGRDHAAGRGGGGAVMGSKNLKAIAVYGSSLPLTPHNPERFNENVKEAIQDLHNEAFVREEMMKFGTPSFFDAMNDLGLVPAYNWQHTTTDFNQYLGHQAYHEKLDVQQDRCYNCPIGCVRKTTIPEGKYKGLSGSGPEYETVAAYGQKLGNTDLHSITAANYISNNLGLDVISTGQVIATAMEWYEKGIINKEATDGLDLTWGNSEAIVKLVERIAYRQGDFATLLGEGSLRAAQTLGGEAIKYVMHVKGQEMAADGVRASKAEALSHMISPRGADHLRPYGATIDAFGYVEEELGVKEQVNPLSEENKDWVKPLEELSMSTNLLGVCLFASITIAIKGKRWAELFSNATGLSYTYADLFKVSERVINLERLFNIREGFTRKDDYLPERFSQESAEEGPGKGQVVDQERLLDLIYTVKGWDKQGIPTKEKLKELGLTEIAQKM
jgi:aldehyde:ferredoxin oxidoreductase